MADIPIIGVPSNYRVPGSFAQILFGQGPATASAGERTAIYCMPMATSAGTWSANTVYRVKNEQDVIEGAHASGGGSPIHRAIRMHLKANKTGKVYALPYAPTSAGAPVAADLDVVFVGDPTGTGNGTLTICGEPCSFSFTSSDTITTLGDKVEAAVNAKEWLPVTATNTAGTVALVAKIAGISQGDGTIPVIRVHCKIDAGVTTTFLSENGNTSDFLGSGTGTAGAEGTTTEAANLATALAAIDAARYYYIGVSAHDATALANVVTHVSAKSDPRPGLRSVAIGGFNGTLAAAQTLANARNYERLQLVWQPNSEHDPAELVGNVLAIRQLFEEADWSENFDSFRDAGKWHILAAHADADWPDDDDQNDAINDGITPIASDQVGSYIVMSVNTRSKNSAGTVDDFRATETHRVSVADGVVDTLLVRHAQQFEKKKLAADQLLADGSVNPNQRHKPKVVRPSTYKPFVKDILDEFDGDQLQNVEESKEGMACAIDPNNAGRMEVGFDIHSIDLFHQMTARVAEVSTG